MTDESIVRKFCTPGDLTLNLAPLPFRNAPRKGEAEAALPYYEDFTASSPMLVTFEQFRWISLGFPIGGTSRTFGLANAAIEACEAHLAVGVK